MNKKKILVLFLAVLTTLTVFGNVVFADEIIKDRESGPDGSKYCDYEVHCTRNGCHKELVGCNY